MSIETGAFEALESEGEKVDVAEIDNKLLYYDVRLHSIAENMVVMSAQKSSIENASKFMHNLWHYFKYQRQRALGIRAITSDDDLETLQELYDNWAGNLSFEEGKYRGKHIGDMMALDNLMKEVKLWRARG